MVPLSIIESMIIDTMIVNGTIEYHSMIVAFNDSIIDLYQGGYPAACCTPSTPCLVTVFGILNLSYTGFEGVQEYS